MFGGVTLSEDEAGSISPEQFSVFALPYLRRLSERYGGIGIHCCADAGHQWRFFRELPGLRYLNLVCPPTRPAEQYIGGAYTYFRDACSQFHGGWTPPGPPSTWPAGRFAGCRVGFDLTAADRAKAAALCAELRAQQNG